MVPKQPALDAAQGEELLQIILGLIDDFIRTGNTEKVFEPLTLLNASRLLLIREYALEPRAYAAIGALCWIRYQRVTSSDVDFEAAYRFFTHVYAFDLRILPDGLREQFASTRPAPEPAWEVWHAHARTLVAEFIRDRGERLLDLAIILYRMSLDAAPVNCGPRPTMEFNLGMALHERFRLLKERDDLDAAIAALQRAAQSIADGDPHRDHIWSALGDALARRFESTRALADADAAVAAYRVGLPLNGPADDAGRIRWFNLGTALCHSFELTRSADTLAEAIDVFRTMVVQTPQDHPAHAGFLSELSNALVWRYEIGGNLEDLRAALRAAESAVAEASAEYPRRAELVHNLAAIRERHARAPVRVVPEFFTRLRPYVASPEALPPEAVEGAPEILPGIVVAIAAEDGPEITLFSGSSAMEIARASFPEAAERGLELLRQLGIENLRKLPFPPVSIMKIGEGRPDSDVFLLEAEDRFVASRITFLEELAERAAPGRPRTHGVLVAIPRRKMVLLHFPSGPGVLHAFEAMQASAGMFGDMPDKLSPHVYYVAPDGRSEIVVSPGHGGAFSHLLYGDAGLLR